MNRGSLPPHPPPEADKTYQEAREEADGRTIASMQRGARIIGAYYKALLTEIGSQEFATNAAERMAMIWESEVAMAMQAERERTNA